MKHLFSILYFTALCGTAFSQPTGYSGNIHITPKVLQQKGDSVYCEIVFNVCGITVDTDRSISFIPTLTAGTKHCSFPEVIIKGRQNYLIYKREMALMSKREADNKQLKAPYRVIDGSKAKTQNTFTYKAVLKLEDWMQEAKLDLYEDFCGCGFEARRVSVSQLVNIVELEKIKLIENKDTIMPHVAYLSHSAEDVKHKNVSEEIYFDFANGKTDFRPWFMNNTRELTKITKLIERTRKDKNMAIQSIQITGYASPEGSMERNKQLADGRAKALVNYLRTRYNYPVQLFDIAYGGENWSALRDVLRKSNYLFADRMIQIIDQVPTEIDYRTNSSLKKSIMDLEGGAPYRTLLKEVFPSLRKVAFRINYEDKKFDLAQARIMVSQRPQNLSLNELFLVANSYEKGSQEFIDLFETAVRMYPDDLTANINAALAALNRKDMPSAQRYLERVQGKAKSPEYYNALGVYHMLSEDYEQAHKHLKQAADMGLSEAKLNMEQLAIRKQNKTALELGKSSTQQ